eukprot:TRINITY_DN14670_c0_g1_i1.p1 TRINITY_DN14670_c0_g1~~TRINITY_DN14670_c0_g1_i1.p1  ORF type:complete len:106 (+),score=36.14 TRINITY_DN14670_c0_g1_i1:3-320(+)
MVKQYLIFFFFKQKTAYEIMPSLVGSEMCIRDSINAEYMGFVGRGQSLSLLWITRGKSKEEKEKKIREKKKKEEKKKLKQDKRKGQRKKIEGGVKYEQYLSLIHI